MGSPINLQLGCEDILVGREEGGGHEGAYVGADRGAGGLSGVGEWGVFGGEGGVGVEGGEGGEGV